jgi:outer membrane receptor protein involved in Fe transport
VQKFTHRGSRQVAYCLRWIASVLCVVAALFGQEQRGEIRLTVKDPSGAPIIATGRLENLAGGPDRVFRTNSQGVAVLDHVAFGHYRLHVSKPRFAAQALSVDVESTAPLKPTMAMQIGIQSEEVDVIANTPLQGINLPLEEIPSPVQTANQTDIANSSALDLADFMKRRLNGVFVNEMQDNPFQPDVNYRGYTASPLLGTPEGLSVYVDGVRQNQPFGDVVSWDLIAPNAIAEMALIPGSDPVFGLNTLGGSITVTTKSGLTNPGWGGQVLYGSSGRKGVQGEWGGSKTNGLNWFFSGNALSENGWRQASPSDVRQGFGRLGWQTGKWDLSLDMSFAYNTMTGNGLQDYRLLQTAYSSVYTVPDTTRNRSPSFNFIARHTFNDHLTFAGNAWYRLIRTEGLNGNSNDDAFTNPLNQLTTDEITTLQGAGYAVPSNGLDPSRLPSLGCIAEALMLGSPDSTCDGVNIFSKEIQNDFGLSGQVSWLTKPGGHKNQLTVGGVFDRGSVTFTQSAQFGYLNSSYVFVGVPAWQDGSTVDGAGDPVDSRVNLHGVTPNGSVFLTDTYSPLQHLSVTVAGRFNTTTINNTDRLNPLAGPGSLTGDYTFNRFNPSLGLTYNPRSWLNFYGNYSQSNRAPTSIELGCADPANPCNLPNALSSDPPLQQVITHTWEAGIRGKSETGHASWGAGVFRANNSNDILFVASQITGTGYFQNFGKTLREGVQANVAGRWWRLNYGLDYTFLSATYQSVETLDGSANNTSDLSLAGNPGVGGIITVHPGNRIPLIPKQIGKAYVDIQAAKKLFFTFGLTANSSSYVRGNENNAYSAGRPYYLGPGITPGYALMNFAAHYDFTPHLRLGIQVDNLGDRHYYTGGQLSDSLIGQNGTPVFAPFPAYATGPAAGSAPLYNSTFYAPGAPRRAWAQLSLRF